MAIQSDAYDLILCQVHPLAVKQTNVKQRDAERKRERERANKANIIEVVW